MCFSITPFEEHDDGQDEARREADELERADTGGVARMIDDHGCVIGEVRQQPGGVAHHPLDLAPDIGEEVEDLPPLWSREPGLANRVDEVAVPLLGGNATRAGVRLHEVAVGFEHREFVADGRR